MSAVLAFTANYDGITGLRAYREIIASYRSLLESESFANAALSHSGRGQRIAPRRSQQPPPDVARPRGGEAPLPIRAAARDVLQSLPLVACVLRVHIGEPDRGCISRRRYFQFADFIRDLKSFSAPQEVFSGSGGSVTSFTPLSSFSPFKFET